jgi:hypothetical protein
MEPKMKIDCGIKSWHDGKIKVFIGTQRFAHDNLTKLKVYTLVSNNTGIMPHISRAKRETMVCRTILERNQILIHCVCGD